MCHEIIHISSGYQILRKVHIFVIYFPTLFIAAWAAVRYFLSLPAQDSAPFKPFNDCLLSLKGGAKSEGETASETEKRLKNRKNKMAESVKRLIFRHFSNFALYQFRCCDVSIHLRIVPR